MYLFTITLLITYAVISHGNEYKKCCKFNDTLSVTNTTFTCVKDKQRRLQILTEESDFLGNNTEGSCVDVSSTELFVFNVSDGEIVEKTSVSEKYFPKCCPINFYYNTVLHSCEKGTNLKNDFIDERFVKVGLQNCKVIVDYEINGTSDFDYRLINTTRKSLNRNNVPYPGSYCIDLNEKNTYVLRECKESIEICDHIRCIKKCCPDGQSFINGAYCYDTYTNGINLSYFSPSVLANPKDPFAIIHNRVCPSIYIMQEEKYIFDLDEKGLFRYYKNTTDSYVYEDIGHMWSYCIEHTKKPNLEGYFFFMCFPQLEVKEKFLYTVWAKVLSCICLTLTVITYFIQNEVKNMFGKVLVNYCVAIFMQYAVLIYAQIIPAASQTTDCILRSFGIIFFATAVFSWSNVMCCDIWWTFVSTKRTIGSHQRKRDLKKLLTYVFYGWGVPAILTLLTFLFYTYKVLPESIQPILAEKKCFFERRKGNYSHALFFNFPHLIIQLINTVLFVKTLAYCLKVKNEINKINDTTKSSRHRKFQKDKSRLSLIIKLSVIMGISFVFEVVSAFFDMSQMGVVAKYIEVVWDTINCLQGVFIFVIFICKKKVLRYFLQKFKQLDRANTSTVSIHTLSTTTSNGMSMKVTPTSKNGKIL